MKKRKFGKLDWEVSEIGLGCWQIGADWGNVSEDKAKEVLKSSFENGVNFFDTADVYGMGRSEKFVGEFIKSCLLYTSPSPRDQRGSRMPSSA